MRPAKRGCARFTFDQRTTDVTACASQAGSPPRRTYVMDGVPRKSMLYPSQQELPNFALG